MTKLKWKQLSKTEYVSEDGRFRIAKTSNMYESYWVLHDACVASEYTYKFPSLTACKEEAKFRYERKQINMDEELNMEEEHDIR